MNSDGSAMSDLVAEQQQATTTVHVVAACQDEACQCLVSFVPPQYFTNEQDEEHSSAKIRDDEEGSSSSSDRDDLLDRSWVDFANAATSSQSSPEARPPTKASTCKATKRRALVDSDDNDDTSSDGAPSSNGRLTNADRRPAACRSSNSTTAVASQSSPRSWRQRRIIMPHLNDNSSSDDEYNNLLTALTIASPPPSTRPNECHADNIMDHVPDSRSSSSSLSSSSPVFPERQDQRWRKRGLPASDKSATLKAIPCHETIDLQSSDEDEDDKENIETTSRTLPASAQKWQRKAAALWASSSSSCSSDDGDQIASKLSRLHLEETDGDSDVSFIVNDDDDDSVIVIDSEQEDSFDVDDNDDDDKQVSVNRLTPPPTQKTSVKRTTPAFAKRRQLLAQQLFQKFDMAAFDGRLTSRAVVTWSNKLRTTAGLTRLERTTTKTNGSADGANRDVRPSTTYHAMIELSTKVVDDERRLHSTLLHEMCHAAAWIADHTSKPPHGACFKKWARRAMRAVPGSSVTVQHDYVIAYKYAWQCVACGLVIQRHSRSVDVTKHVCGRCRSKLAAIEVPRAKDGATMIVPRKNRAPSAYNRFVQEQSATIRAQLQQQASSRAVLQKEVLAECARLWRERKGAGL